MGSGEEDLKALAKAIIETWEAIPQEQIADLIKSMPRRCAAVIQAEGWIQSIEKFDIAYFVKTVF